MHEKQGVINDHSGRSNHHAPGLKICRQRKPKGKKSDPEKEASKLQSKFKFLLLSLFLLSGFSVAAVAEKPRQVNISDEIENIKRMDISHVDPATVPDGEYTGEFPFTQKYLYKVRVTVKSGRIEDIEVLENGTGNEYAEKGLRVIPRMLEKQSPDVDAVSGATVTSKALMKCVERALNKGRME